MTALQTIYNNLQNGKQYGRTVRNVRFPYFDTALSCDEDFVYIRWHHYGSSANSNTIDDLRWILHIIFKMTANEFLNHYELRQ